MARTPPTCKCVEPCSGSFDFSGNVTVGDSNAAIGDASWVVIVAKSPMRPMDDRVRKLFQCRTNYIFFKEIRFCRIDGGACWTMSVMIQQLAPLVSQRLQTSRPDI
jgi:hypothetical protein